MSVMQGVGPVRVARGEVTIPATPWSVGRLPLVGRLNPNRVIYPYRLLNELEFGVLRPRTFRAITLENEFLQLTVLPELGGRLHRALYKPDHYDLFYHNEIRGELVATRGAWYAGGVEFNFPVSHSLTTCAGVEHAVRRDEDGSAWAIVSNVCRFSHMRWQVAIGLAPGSTAIRFITYLLNRTAWPHRYFYWLNAAVPQGPQIRYHFSASRLVGHLQEIDGVRTRLDNFPLLRNGCDARVPAKLADTTSIFMLDNHSGFFGYYDTDADLGLVRSAPVRNVPGNKIWSWGNTDYGTRFNQRLVAPGAQFYGELQSGRPESQTDWSIIGPFELIEAEECWYPIPRLGDMTDGSDALTLLARPGEGRLRLSPNRPFANLTVRVESADQPGRPLAEQTFEAVGPPEPIEMEMQRTDRPIRVVAVDSGGRTVLDYRDPSTRPESIICEIFEHKAGESHRPATTAAELAVWAVSAYRANELVESEQSARAALAVEPGFGPAHHHLGFLLRCRGRLDEAAEHLKAAVLADPMDYAAYYLFAVTLVEAGKLDQAALELERVVAYSGGQVRAWAARVLAGCLLRLGRPDEARRLMGEWPGEVAFGAMGRLAYRVGLAADPRSRWWGGPSDLPARIVAGGKAAAVLDEWWTLNVKADDEAADFVLELAEEFIDSGDAANARAVLDWLTGHATLAAVCPLAHYRLGELIGDLPAAARRAAEATDRARLAWPGRMTDGRLLEAVCRAAPDDALAHALLGLHRLWLGQAEGALEPLEGATALDDSDPVAWRNLGLARWSLGQPWEACLAAYQRAVALWPDYSPLIAETDRMLAGTHNLEAWEAGAPTPAAPHQTRRRLLYDDLRPSLADDRYVAIRRAELALVSGDYQAGLDELAGRLFHPGEARFDTQRLYMRLNVVLGEQLAGRGDWGGALASFRASLEYPENFQIGRPRRAQETRQRYLAALMLGKLGDEPAARAELEQAVTLCLRGSPMEHYFGILALRRLGRDEQADQWLAELDEWTANRSKLATAEGKYWAKVSAAMLARARGDRDRSNRLLAEIDPRPGSDLADFLASELY